MTVSCEQWQPLDTAPKDGTAVEIHREEEFSLVGYFGGGADLGWREWHSCRLIMPGATQWRPLKEPQA